MSDEISVGEGFFIGICIGLVTAILGAYKDTTFEEFDTKTFFRSPIIAGIYGAIGAQAFKKNKSEILLAAFASTAERITVETWKATTGKTPGKFSWGEELDRGWLLKRQQEKD